LWDSWPEGHKTTLKKKRKNKQKRKTAMKKKEFHDHVVVVPFVCVFQ